MILVRTLIFTLLVPGTVAAWLPVYLLASSGELRIPEPGPRWLGVIPVMAGAAAYLWCAWGFSFTGKGTPGPWDPPRHLVVRGLYRLTRNPMYVAVTLVLLGEVAFFGSRVLFMYTLAVVLMFHLRVVYFEEPTMRRIFGAAYEEYCRAVPRWVPDFRSRSGLGEDLPHRRSGEREK
jgi:protein-S-isoprenylcysteine O-methyltransferase Ste14